MAKRAFDLVVGSVLAVVSLPIVALAAVAVGISLRATPFFVQRRIGQGGRPLLLPKLRTLPRECHPWLLKHELEEGAISPVGRFLRRRHFDELPQLWLVPLGRLSLVGPRPKMPDEVEPVDRDYGERRVEVPQGCTGLWQIGRHIDGLPSDAPEYDLFYLEHASLPLDIWILWRTALIMAGLVRPVGLEDVPVLLRKLRRR